MKVREVLDRLREEGWYLARQKGTSHRQFRHTEKRDRRVTVAGVEGMDLGTGTLRRIFEQAGWDWSERR